MQSTLDPSAGLERRLSVRVPEDRISGEIATRLQRLSRRVRIDGFRPGKAPLRLVEQRYGTQIREEVLNDLLKETFTHAMEEHQLRPAGTPRIDPFSAEPGQGMSYTATFEVYPEIGLVPLADLVITRPVTTVTEADVDFMLEVLRRRQQSWATVDRPAREGDRLLVDFNGLMDGVAVPEISAERVRLVLGAGRFIPGFEAGLVGGLAGQELDLPLTLAEDFPLSQYRGQPAVFHILIKEVEEPRLPEVDEAFMRTLGIAEGGVEALRREVGAHMAREADNEIRKRFRENCLEALRLANPVEIPRALLESEMERIKGNLRETYGKEMLERWQSGDEAFVREKAAKNIHGGLLLNALVRLGNLKVDAADVRAEVERRASVYQDPEAMASWIYRNEDRLHEVEGECLELKVIGHIAANARIVEESVVCRSLFAAEEAPATG